MKMSDVQKALLFQSCYVADLLDDTYFAQRLCVRSFDRDSVIDSDSNKARLNTFMPVYSTW